MENIIIGFYGKANSGKTTVLNLLIDELKKKNKHFEEDNDVGDVKDKLAVFTIGKQKIGISTGGDTGEYIDTVIEKVLIGEKQCNIIVTATRTKGATCERLNAISDKHQYRLVWVQKTPEIHSDWGKKDYFINEYNRMDMEYMLEYLLDKIC